MLRKILFSIAAFFLVGTAYAFALCLICRNGNGDGMTVNGFKIYKCLPYVNPDTRGCRYFQEQRCDKDQLQCHCSVAALTQSTYACLCVP